jgi:hypothetical protein
MFYCIFLSLGHRRSLIPQLDDIHSNSNCNHQHIEDVGTQQQGQNEAWQVNLARSNNARIWNYRVFAKFRSAGILNINNFIQQKLPLYVQAKNNKLLEFISWKENIIPSYPVNLENIFSVMHVARSRDW